MADSIATRVTQIISGNVHSLLDKIEDANPEAALAQAVREVDHVTDDVKAELGRAEAAKHLAVSGLNRLNSRNEALAEQIELALKQGKDDHARVGVSAQIDTEDQIAVVQKSLQEANERATELESYISALNAKKREMEAALQQFIAAKATQSKPGDPSKPGSNANSKVEKAGAAFDRVLARQTGVAGLVGATSADAKVLEELQDNARRERVEQRMNDLRKKLS